MSKRVIYEVVSATPTLALEIAAKMRRADAEEAWAANRATPDQAVLCGLEMSPDPMVGLADGRSVCIFGVGQWSVLALQGIPWLLATDELPRHARYFLRASKQYVLGIKESYQRLANYVDARNTEAVRWVAWLGFKLDDPIPFGFDKLPFHRFHWEMS